MRAALCWGAAIALTLLAFVALPLVGAQPVHLSDVLGSGDATANQIFWSLRVPRVTLAFAAGALLALCGMTFQAMFRNPLATESTLGVASGASLGAAIYLRLGLVWGLPFISGMSLAAFAGALLSIGAVYGLTKIRRGTSNETLLLAGVALGFFFSALILLIQSTSDLYDAYRLMRWMMGGLTTVGYDAVLSLAPVAVVGFGLVIWHRRELNLLLTGEDLAASRGVAVARVKAVLFVGTSLMVGGAVALVGPIGFVGMIVPHVARKIVGPRHSPLIPATAMLGGVFLAGCDTLARTVIAPAELPVGAITACLGGPFFLLLLMRPHRVV